MALVFHSGFEMGDFSEFATTTGSPAVVEADGWGSPKTGTYCMQCDTTGGAAQAFTGAINVQRASVYIYIVTAPSVDCVILGSFNSIHARLTPDRYIKLHDGVGDQGTSDTQLALSTWYRISISCTDAAAAKVYINGIEEISATGLDDTNTTYHTGLLTSCTADIYFDDIVGEDTSSTDDIGDIRVARASPNAAGQYAEFDTISGYTNCDEVPANDADFADDSGVSVLHRECYNLQDSATIGLGGSDTIRAVSVWVRGYDSNGAQGIFVRDNSVDYKTLTAWGKAFTWKNKLYDTNAPRGTAWTTAIFNAFQAGGYSEGSKDVYVSCVMVMVAFIPVTFQELTAAAVAETSSVATASISGSGDAPLTGAIVGVSSSVQLATVSGTGDAPLTGTIVSVASSVSQASIENVSAEQELTAAVVSVASSVITSTISGSGNAPLTGTIIGVVSSVVAAAIVGTGTAPLTAAAIGVTSSVQTASIRTSVTILTAGIVSVASSVQAASIAGSGNAPLSGAVVSVTSSIQIAAIAGSGDAPLTAAVVQVVSSVQGSVIAGLGNAPLTGTVIAVTSSVAQASIGFIMQASPVAAASSVQTASVAGSGDAPLTGTIISVTGSVQVAAITGSGNAPLTAAIVSVTGSVQVASIAGDGIAPLTAVSISVVSSIQNAALSGSGNAPLAGAIISVASSVANATLAPSGAAPLAGTVVGVASSVQTASISGLGNAPLTGAVISATSSVVQASISGTGTSPLTAAVVNVLASVVAASISGSGDAPLTEDAIAVSATVNRAVIAGIGIANLTAGYVSVVTSVAQGQAELLAIILFASPLAVVSSVVETNITLSWVIVCIPLGIDPDRLEATRVPISRLETTEVEPSRQPLCRPTRRYT